ncbi:hypothetical protein [Rathayibacter sp. AY1D9]|uniref:hypothetical protein n=1 Tax=Rathayibacter sp. AY1D9 TaxID=2080548 RepID=UPI0015E349AF|nr:hypothetical protein [Rathayibacter sp. AY1D9]
MATAPDPASAIAHAGLAGIAVGAVAFAGSLLAVPLLYAGYAGLAAFVLLPLIATALLLIVSRAVTGRLHAGANLVLGALLTLATLAAVVTPLVTDAPPLPAPLLATLPLLLGAVAAFGSLVVHPGRARIVGAVATVALLATVASPVVQTVLGRSAAARASQEAEYEARLDSSVVPFESDRLTTTAVVIGQYESSIRASEDLLARQDTDHLSDPGDITILTSRFNPEFSLESQVCSLYTNPELAGTAGNTCDRRDDGVWVLEVDGSPMLARLIDNAVVSVAGADQERLEELLAAVVPMEQDEYERRLRLAFERDLRA